MKLSTISILLGLHIAITFALPAGLPPGEFDTVLHFPQTLSWKGFWHRTRHPGKVRLRLVSNNPVVIDH
jgi:hypothetical protein